MAWNVVTSTKGNFIVASETLTLPSAASTDTPSSIIDFVPPNRDFIVIANTAATNTNSDGDVDVEGTHDDGTTYFKMKTDLIASFDTATVAAMYDISANGQTPKYRLVLTHDGNQSAESVEVVVLVPPQA